MQKKLKKDPAPKEKNPPQTPNDNKREEYPNDLYKENLPPETQLK